MTQPTTQASFSPPWFLIVGVLAGAALIAFIVWDSPGNRGKRAGSAHIVEITKANWQKEVVKSSIPVVVDFTASWCGPCQEFAPTVDKIAQRYAGRVKVGKFDVGPGFSKGQEFLEKFGFNGIPHVMIFTGGDQPVQEFAGGAPSETELVKAIDAALATR
jgi:thioredoxin 1